MTRWIPLYVGSTILVLALSTLTGCRFGNKVEQNNSTDPGTIVELWNTLPQSLTFCAEAAGQPSAYCRSTTTNYIPLETSYALTNPTLMVKFPSASDWYFINLSGDTTGALPVDVAGDGTLSMLAGNDTAQFMVSTCVAPFRMTIDQGKRTHYDSAQDTADGPVQGRAAFRISWTTDTSSAGCADALQAASACWNDPDGCMQKEAYAEYLQDYLQDQNGNGLPPELIGDIRKLTYEVTYQ
jgi:hypothetical protein